MNPDEVGYFYVSFKPEINHEYGFVLYTDGKILPNIFNKDECDSADELIFSKFCNDPNLYEVKFIQNIPLVPEGHEWPKPPEKLK